MPEPGVCAVVLAAGEGIRLRPLTRSTPKALCPVGNVPMLDRALAAVASLGFSGPESVAVNAWYLPDRLAAHVGGRAHVSIEDGRAPLGSAGGLGALRDWIGGRHVLVANADAYLAGGELAPLLSGWDGREVRLLGVPAGDRAPEFGRYLFAGFSLLPGAMAATLLPEPTDLVRTVWRPAESAGKLSVVDYGGTYLDCGTPPSYLAANLDAARRSPTGSLVGAGARVPGIVSDSVVGDRAVVVGSVERSVVWADCTVAADERLSDAIRYDGGTVDARTPAATRL